MDCRPDKDLLRKTAIRYGFRCSATRSVGNEEKGGFLRRIKMNGVTDPG